MWFKNLRVYISDQELHMDAQVLEQALRDAHCPPCGAQVPAVSGFVPPIEGQDAMTFMTDDLALCMHQEITRLLPGKVIAGQLQERIDQVEVNEHRTVGRKEKADIREQVIFELLPKAFTQAQKTPCIIDFKNNSVWVDTSAAGRAETVIDTLRDALGSLPVVPPSPNVSPADNFTRWLAGSAPLPEGFELGDRCLLESMDESRGRVQISSMNLQQEEILAHLNANMLVTRLNLAVDDAVEFDLDHELTIKRIRPLDILQNDIEDVDATDAVEELTSLMAIQGGLLRGVLDRVLRHFQAVVVPGTK